MKAMLSPVLMLVLAETDKGAIWYFKQMDSAGMAVAVVLLICSFIGWGAMIGKWSDVQELRRRNHAFERRLRDEASVVALNFPRGSNLGPYEFLVAEAVSAVQRHKGRLVRQSDVTLCMGHVENAVQRGVARTMVKYEDKMVLLSSLVSGGPFLGLLGTVTGLATLFPEQGLPDSQTLTRGVGLALSTTMIGLCIAIPALVGANWLGRRLEILSSRLDVLVEALEARRR